jgi:hypothetical protein
MFYFSSADTEAPRVDWCESPPTFLSGEEEVDVYWEEPIFSDNSRLPVKVLRVFHLKTDGKKFEIGK